MKLVFLLALALNLCSALPRINYAMPESVPGFTQSLFSTYIDHFGSSTQTFNMRYFTNSQYWQNSTSNPGPIFFYCGNEGAVEMFIENSGYISVLAQQLQAVVIYGEHRYFGQSMPFGNQSFNNPQKTKYLSPHQALADYAYLLTYLKTVYYDAPVIAWGGSYGGMLAAWFRIKYPNLVNGAVAASAPIYHFLGTVDPELFNQIVTDDYAAVAPECPAYIKQAYDILQLWSKNTKYYYKLQNIFNTCTQVLTYQTANNIINWLSNSFTYMAMTNYPYSTNFLEPMPAFPVTVACGMLNGLDDDSTDTDILEAVRDAANVYYNTTGNNTCNLVDQQYENDLGDNGWDYLSCTTLLMPISSDGINDMFPYQPFSLTQIDQYCASKWGVAPNPYYVQTFFGADTNPANPLRYASNIVFSNGALDPWQSGSVLQSLSKNSLVAFVMQGAAHHLDLRTPNVADPADVVRGRLTEKALIQYWLNGQK